MAAGNKFNVFTYDQLTGAHTWNSNSYKVMLTNTAPSATNAVKADITEISAGNGYTTGGTATTITVTTSSGTAKIVGTDVVFTATGAVGPLRYAVLYNDTTSSPAKPLVGWWDYGSSITLASGETFTVDFDATNGIIQVT